MREIKLDTERERRGDGCIALEQRDIERERQRER